MPVINLLIGVVLVWMLLWLGNTILPIEQRAKQILNVVVIILLVLWILGHFVNFNVFSGWRVG